jgi:hypothetical protein
LGSTAGMPNDDQTMITIAIISVIRYRQIYRVTISCHDETATCGAIPREKPNPRCD